MPTLFSSEMNTKRIGNISEAKVIAAFVERGWPVLIPFGDNEPYDVVVEVGGDFKRVQVKTGRRDQGCLTFNTYSVTGRTHSQVATRYEGKIEWFAVYFPENDGIYIFPIEECSTPKPMFRIDGGRTNKFTRWAENYLLSR